MRRALEPRTLAVLVSAAVACAHSSAPRPTAPAAAPRPNVGAQPARAVDVDASDVLSGAAPDTPYPVDAAVTGTHLFVIDDRGALVSIDTADGACAKRALSDTIALHKVGAVVSTLHRVTNDVLSVSAYDANGAVRASTLHAPRPVRALTLFDIAGRTAVLDVAYVYSQAENGSGWRETKLAKPILAGKQRFFYDQTSSEPAEFEGLRRYEAINGTRLLDGTWIQRDEVMAIGPCVIMRSERLNPLHSRAFRRCGRDGAALLGPAATFDECRGCRILSTPLALGHDGSTFSVGETEVFQRLNGQNHSLPVGVWKRACGFEYTRPRGDVYIVKTPYERIIATSAP